MENQEYKTKTVTGVIYPGKRDNRGNVISILLDSFDDDQDTYTIFPDKRGAELFDVLNRKIKISGRVSENENGDLVLYVKTYNIQEDS